MAVLAVSMLIFLAATLWWHWLRAAAAPPHALSTALISSAIQSVHGDRHYQVFIPAGYTSGSPVVFVLHGSRGTIKQIRTQTGFEFDRLADRDGFIVVYPQGFKRYWNDCRVKGDWAAKQLKVDDVGFLTAIVERLRQSHSAGPAFFAGYSNGGHMCYRMAFETPGIVSAIAPIAAGLPTPDNLVSPMPAHATSCLLVNGTSDPINPYGGGRVTIFGFGDRGTVYSASDSASVLARRLGPGAHEPDRAHVRPDLTDGPASVERMTWATPAGEVTLITVLGGGHVIPQPRYRFPRLVGPTEMGLNAPAECWAFFQRELGRHT